jgi:hypothetical protein
MLKKISVGSLGGHVPQSLIAGNATVFATWIALNDVPQKFVILCKDKLAVQKDKHF